MTAGEALRALDDPVTGRLPEAVRLAAYRVVEEALANTQRHAAASRAAVELDVDPGPGGALRLAVADDGRGLTADAGRAGPGLGLNAVAARVGRLGGTWALESTPGRGTRLTAYLPLDAAPAPAEPGEAHAPSAE